MERLDFEVEGFEALRNEFRHVLDLLGGMENLHYASGNSNRINAEGAYTNGVLNLYNINLSSYAGQESFLDNIKAAGAKVYEWIKALLTSIKNFFTGKGTKGAEEATNDAIKTIDKLDAEVLIKEIVANVDNPEKTLIVPSKEVMEAWEEKGKEVEDSFMAMANKIQEDRVAAAEAAAVKEAAAKLVRDEELRELMKDDIDKVTAHVRDLAVHYLDGVADKYAGLTSLNESRSGDPLGQLGLTNIDSLSSEARKLAEKGDGVSSDKLRALLIQIKKMRTDVIALNLKTVSALNKINEDNKNVTGDDGNKELKVMAHIQKVLAEIGNSYNQFMIEADLRLAGAVNKMASKAHNKIVAEARKVTR